MSKRYYPREGWLAKILLETSIRGTVCTFLLFLAGAALAYFSPELYFKFYGVHTTIPGRYRFFGVLVFAVGCWILYLDISYYIKKRRKGNNRGQTTIK